MIKALEHFSNDEFEDAYSDIYFNLTAGSVKTTKNSVYILGGQPGAGKTNFFEHNKHLEDYVMVNGDDYRKYHPHFDIISNHDIQKMPNITQRFCNLVVERLINDIGKDGYNMIVEGTLRNPDVPINTCRLLKSKGYYTNLVVMACDIETSWKSTLKRADKMAENGEYPRFVSIDIFNDIVTNIADNFEKINSAGCFDNISVVNREGIILYPNDKNISAYHVLETQLNLQNWKSVYSEYINNFEVHKKQIIEKTVKNDKHQSILRKLEVNKGIIAAEQKDNEKGYSEREYR